jgi:hypothetical protein
LKIRNRYGERKLPAQATVYRFFWFLDAELEAMSAAMLAWGRDVLRAVGREETLAVAADGKHLRGTRRGRKGEEALVQGLGLSLGGTAVTTTEAQAAEGLLVRLARMEELGVDWLITADAGLTSKALAQKAVEQNSTASSPPGSGPKDPGCAMAWG